MVGPHPAVAAVRLAVRAELRAVVGAHCAAASDRGEGAPDGPPLVLAACSGGADSLALAAALAFEAPRAGVVAGAVVVDHGLQADSEHVAARAGRACADLGLRPVEIVRVRVDAPRVEASAAAFDPASAAVADRAAGGGPEARARRARYEAFDTVAERTGAAAILLGHTRDDQAEQVLLGLARGSGARSLAGMPRVRGYFRRPLLGVSREATLAACEAEGLPPWHDPHNADPRYLRVRARTLLGELEGELGPGVVAALARSADLLRDDADALDALADDECAALGEPPWPAVELMRHPRAVRSRLWVRLARRAGVSPARLTSRHIEALDALVTSWHGQGPVVLPGTVRVWRAAAAVHVDLGSSG